MNKTIQLFGVVNLPQMESAALQVLRSGSIGSGPNVAQFESGLAALIGREHVVSTVDMTSALQLALHLAGVRAGDEVLTGAFACMSTNAAIGQCGAVPVWVDVKPHTVEIDEHDLAAKISDKTRAVVLYHVAGYPGPAREIAALCRARGIMLIEDCNNALLAMRDNEQVGTHGDFAVYSFYPNRQINTTEGGALVCKSAESAARARRLRRFGIDATTFRSAVGEISPASDIAEIGWAFTMNNLCAGLGLAQLDSVGERLARTRANAAALGRLVGAIAGVSLIRLSAVAEAAYWVLLIEVDRRDAVLAHMKANGVHVSSLHYRNDRYSGFRQDHAGTSLPNTTYLQDHVLALPCGWWLSDADLTAIATALARAVAASGAP